MPRGGTLNAVYMAVVDALSNEATPDEIRAEVEQAIAEYEPRR